MEEETQASGVKGLLIALLGLPRSCPFGSDLDIYRLGGAEAKSVGMPGPDNSRDARRFRARKLKIAL
jgi:hypothetical protein